MLNKQEFYDLVDIRYEPVHEARLDVAARVTWAADKIIFFDERVFYSNASRYVNQSLQQCYASNENEKKRKCKCKKFYSVLTEMIATKRKQECSGYDEESPFANEIDFVMYLW